MQRRHIRLDGNLNLRDLGGYEARPGTVVRWGSVFRSDALHALSDADLEIVAALGIRVVFDLRNHGERISHPLRLPPEVELLERVSPSIGGDSRTLEARIIAGSLPLHDDEGFGDVYIQLLERLRPELKVILERAADAPNRPLLIQCTAGKDRTGIAAAVLLGLLGVADETILDDYELTSVYYAPWRLRAVAELMAKHNVEQHRVLPLLWAHRPVLATMLAHLHRAWSGYDTFAVEHLGVAPDLPRRLRAALLVNH